MTKAASAGLNTHLQGEVTTLATAVRLTRTDGVTFRFTDASEDQVNVDFGIGEGSQTYLAKPSYERTNIANNADLEVDNVDVVGILDDESITEEDMRLGLFDFAEIHMFIFNYEDTSQGVLKMRRGWIGEVSVLPFGTFKAELNGLLQAMQRRIGELYSKDCRADLGDSRCAVPVEPPVLQRNQLVTESAISFFRVQTDPPPPDLTLTEISHVWQVDVTGPTLVDETADANSDTNADWQVFPASEEVGDYVAIGFKNPFGAITLDYLNGTAGVGGAVTWEYWNGTTWTALSGVTDGTSGFTAAAADGLEVSWTIPTDWKKATLSTSASLYWVRARVTTVYTTNPVLDQGFVQFFTSFSYEDKIYKPIGTGTTAGTQPAYDTTPGNDTTDGTATMRCFESWSRAVKVVAVDGGNPRTIFNVSELTPNTGGPNGGFPDFWMNEGVITWETGDNAGRSFEVKGFLADDGITIEQNFDLFLPTPFNIQVGDIGRVYPGCDKLFDTCRIKFGNQERFVGEPYVPGDDILLQTPEAKV